MDLPFHNSLSIRKPDDLPSAVIAYYIGCLTAEETAQICRQCEGNEWHQNCQVLWSGLDQQQVQRWASDHEMQTLTKILGPLKDQWHRNKNRKQISTSMKGASAIFAFYISHGDTVTVLSPPPPERFHPSEQTNFQIIEEPILKGLIGGISVSRIEIVHPMVKGAEDFHYQIWPVDETHSWIERFGKQATPKPHWRAVKADFLDNIMRKSSIVDLKPENLMTSAMHGGASRPEKKPSSTKDVVVTTKKAVVKTKKWQKKEKKRNTVKKKTKVKKKIKKRAEATTKSKKKVKGNIKRKRRKAKVK